MIHAATHRSPCPAGIPASRFKTASVAGRIADSSGALANVAQASHLLRGRRDASATPCRKLSHAPSRWTAPLSLLIFVVSSATSLAADPRGDAPATRLRSPEEERPLLHVPPGFEVQLVAAEPDIQKPMNIAFDAMGRVWVTGSTLYPWPARRDALGQPIAAFEKNWDDNPVAFRAAAAPPAPREEATDTVRVLSDFGPDGRARKVTVFADGLNIPIGIVPLPRGPGAKGDTVLVFSIPAIWRLTDTDGDGRADVREKLYDGFGFKDTHGMSSNYWLWLDGWVYGTHGFSNPSEVRDREGRTVSLQSGNTYRFRPDGSRFELFARGQTNPFGLAFDTRGDVYTADSHSKPVYLLIPGGYYEGISREHDGLGFAPPITVDDHGSSAIAGIAHYSAAGFPREYQGNLFNGNPVTRRINRDRLDWNGSSPRAVRQADFLVADDPAFRPVQVKLGPDGALWVADFYNPIIGHYEVPLTHPARDNRHGRIWRIVWRGLDGSVPPPTLPDLTRETSTTLAARLGDPNLVVRSLAASELMSRADAASAVSTLSAAAARLVAGLDSNADGTAVLPLLMVLERLGGPDDALLRQALSRRDSDAALGALRVLAARAELPADAETLFSALLATPAPEMAARLAAEVFRRHPKAWQPALILALLGQVPVADVELIYALRLALKTHALTASGETLRAWAAVGSATADRVADVCLAVPTPAAAEFLLGHLEKTKFGGPRAGEFARQAVLHLPPDGFAAILPLLQSLGRAPVAQRVAFAEGLATVAAQPQRSLPPQVDRWMRAQLVGALGDRDPMIVLRAIAAVKPLPFSEKADPLRRLALDPAGRENIRTAALRALAPGTETGEQVLREILSGTGSNALRRAAADLLGTANASAAARAALVGGFSGASADLALALALGLARSDAGAAELLELAAQGRIRPTLLRHRHVALALEKRAAHVRERAAALTAAFPPEDVRLDALIAQRMGVSATLKTDSARGAPLFIAHCAACHRLRENGGSIGPNLDGAGSRSVARLVEDILDPSRNVDPAFRLATITLKNGETKTGMNLREQAERAVVTDPATGQDVIVPRGEVAEIAALPVSAMPASFENLLSAQELFDLIEYLRLPAK